MGGSTSKSKEQEMRASSRSGGDGSGGVSSSSSKEQADDDMCTANFFKLLSKSRKWENIQGMMPTLFCLCFADLPILPILPPFLIKA